MYKPIIYTVCLLLSGILFSQEMIRGTISDAQTGEPIQYAFITNPDTGTTRFSDENGRFVFDEEAEELEISADGYQMEIIRPDGSDLLVRLSSNVSQLDEIVITASRQGQRRTEVPIAINVLSQEQIAETKATRLDELLNKVPGVFMTDLGNEQHNMSIRQPLSYNSTFLYLEDGIPLRVIGDFNHNALIEINQASIERIEAVKGPASSLYGSEAVGGALNFITQKPTPELSGRIQGEIGTRGYKRTDFAVSDTKGKFGFFAGGYYADRNAKATEHNDFHKFALTLRGDYTFSERTSWATVADIIRYKTDQIGGLDSLHFYSKDYASLYTFTYRSVDAFRLRNTLSHDWNENSHTDFNLVYRHSSVGQNPFYSIKNDFENPLKAKGEINDDTFDSYGVIIQHAQKFPSLKSKLIAGVGFDYSPVIYHAELINIDRNEAGFYYQYEKTDSLLTSYRANLSNTGIYAQWEYKPIRKMHVVLAARYDRLGYDYTNHLPPGSFSGAPSTKNHFDHFTPKLGLTYDLGKSRGVYVNFSVGFAPPNITDLYRGVQVPVLEPATYHNYEVGGWLSFLNHKGYLEVSLYTLSGKDEIVSVRLPDGSSENRNAGKTRHRGIEWNLTYKIPADLNLRIGGTVAGHKYRDFIENGEEFSGNDMPQAPSYLLNGEITWKPQFLKGFRIGLETQGMGSYYTDAANTAKYKGFTVFNLRTGYKMTNWEAWINWNNIFDKNYAVSVEKTQWGTTYRPGELSTVSFGIGYRFGSFK